MKTLSFWVLGAGLLVLSLTPAGGQEAAYVGIPDGFDFPASEAELLAALDSGNETRLREHAWKVFAGLTQPARPQDANSEAIWETWYTGAETFASGPSPQGVRSLKKELRLLRQFEPLERRPVPQSVGESQLSGTLFNHELRKHTKDNGLTSKAKLTTINNGWSNQTPVADRKVIDYPPKAMSLKLVWMPVRKQGMSTLPIWDEQPIVSQAPAQDINTWKRVVVVDPNRETIPADETATGRWARKDFPGSRVVPLNDFYHFPMSADQAAPFGADAGDYAVLVAMHYTTREIPNWVWATFWWHDQPNDGRFAQGRLGETELKGIWRHFLMDVSYDMKRPVESDGTPNAVFNPWLEARFINGVNSNCMSCHQRALWPMPPAPPPGSRPWLPVTRSPVDAGDQLFRTRTKLDFLWSLALETPDN
jgi:hypothetical protein